MLYSSSKLYAMKLEKKEMKAVKQDFKWELIYNKKEYENTVLKFKKIFSKRHELLELEIIGWEDIDRVFKDLRWYKHRMRRSQFVLFLLNDGRSEQDQGAEYSSDQVVG